MNTDSQKQGLPFAEALDELLRVECAKVERKKGKRRFVEGFMGSEYFCKEVDGEESRGEIVKKFPNLQIRRVYWA